MNSRNDIEYDKYMAHIKSMREVECSTCKKKMLVQKWRKSNYECENCYMTKLEFMAFEETKLKKYSREICITKMMKS